MAQQGNKHGGLLRQLLHDRTANTIAIGAAALVPLLALIGSGVDTSRYYMTVSRMQAACDAGALAARRAMVTTTFTAAHRDTGFSFFDQNFPDGMFGVTGKTRNYTASANGIVTGTASATLPTAIMNIFGYDAFNVAVTCSADINISNTDIMFVLDVTGSMSECPDETECNSGPGSKIVGLRSAVMGFYDTVSTSVSPTAQVRWGVVPYSQQVNIGHLIPVQHMASSHTYQSRVARFQQTSTTIPEVRVGDWFEYWRGIERMPRNTANFGSTNLEHFRFRNRSGDPNRRQEAAFNACNAISGITYTVGEEQWFVETDTYITNAWPDAPIDWRAGCEGRISKRRRATAADVAPERVETSTVFRDFVYCPVDTSDATPCDVSNPAGSPPGWESVSLATLYDDYRIDLPTGPAGAMETHVWQGCIEEPTTVRQATFNPIPAAAHDLDINLVPANESQRWKPALPNAVWRRHDGGNTLNWLFQTGDEDRPRWVCPPAGFRLREIGPGKAFTRASLQAYVDGLTPSGNTYHDIGMVWGARLISPKGIFRADNEVAPNGEDISRHIVFMTDGLLVTNVENYSTHGTEWWDRRITDNGTNTQEAARRAERLQAICRAAQAENITVWVVAFGVTLTPNLRGCASPGRAYQADNTAALNEAFQDIAQKIAALRLTS